MVREEIEKMIAHVPFVPFTIELSSGRKVPVLSRDHIFLGPRGSLVVVADDKGLYDLLPILHISALTTPQPASND